jgi:hypothetical protein
MSRRDELWRILDRLTAFLPGASNERAEVLTTPSPNEPGLDTETRRARWRLWRHRYAKQGRGGYR